MPDPHERPLRIGEGVTPTDWVASLIAGDGFRIRLSGLLGSIVGAILVLWIWGAVRGRSSATR